MSGEHELDLLQTILATDFNGYEKGERSTSRLDCREPELMDWERTITERAGQNAARHGRVQLGW